MLVVKKNCRMLNVQSMFVRLIEYIMSLKTNNIHIYLEMYVACLLPLSVSSVVSSTDNVILTRVHHDVVLRTVLLDYILYDIFILMLYFVRLCVVFCRCFQKGLYAYYLQTYVHYSPTNNLSSIDRIIILLIRHDADDIATAIHHCSYQQQQ